MYSNFDYLKTEPSSSNYRHSRDYNTYKKNTDYNQKNYDRSHLSPNDSSNTFNYSKNTYDNYSFIQNKKSYNHPLDLRNSVNVLPNYQQELERAKYRNLRNNKDYNTARNKSPYEGESKRDYKGQSSRTNGRSLSPFANKKYDLQMSAVSAHPVMDYQSRKNKYLEQTSMDTLQKSSASGYASKKYEVSNNTREFDQKALIQKYRNYFTSPQDSKSVSTDIGSSKRYSPGDTTKYDKIKDYTKPQYKQYASKSAREDYSRFDTKDYYSANSGSDHPNVSQFGSSSYQNSDKRFVKKKYEDVGLLSTLDEINQILTKSKMSRIDSKSKINQYKSEEKKKDTSIMMKEPPTFTNKINFNISITDFNLGKTKGEGKFGTVYVATHKATSTIYAIKKIPKQIIKSHMLQNQLALEIKLQTYINHPNILKLYGFFDDWQNIYLVLEYMEEGTLFEYLRKRTNKLTQKEVSCKIKDVSSAIKYLHDLDIAHRDIKPQNIVISGGVAKLCDFGWATRCTDRRKTYCGTFDYAAPEILQGRQYDWCVDLWCLGVLTFELLTGKVPFYHISRKQTMKKILRVDRDQIVFPPEISWKAKDFVQCLIKKDPHERSRADELMGHPFLAEEKKQTPQV